MYSLLPTQNVKNLISNYRGRLAAVFSLLMSFMFVLGFLSLIPAYIAVNGFDKQADAQVKSAEAERTLPQSQDVKQKVLAAKFLANAIGTTPTLFVPSFVVNKISSARSGGVTISSFEMAKAETAQLNLSIKGVAASRDALADFRKNLLAVPGITKVDLPASALAKSKDLQYSLAITIDLSAFK